MHEKILFRSFIENDLLIEIFFTSQIYNFVAEFIKTFRNCFILGRTELFCCFQLISRINSLALVKQLRQIFRLSVSYCPGIILNFEFWSLLIFFFFSRRLLLDFLFFPFFTFSFWFFLNYFWLREFFKLNIFNLLFFILEL